MKRRVLSIFTMLLIATLLISCTGQDKDTIESNTDSIIGEMEPIKKSVGNLNVMVDPRIELLSAVQLQSEYDILTEFKFDYKDDMNDYFKNYKGHKAVKEFKKLNKSGFNYDAPPTVMLYLTNPPNLEKVIDFSDYLVQRARGEKKILRFVQSLRGFYQDTNFKEFFDKNTSYYKDMVEIVCDDIEDMKIVEVLEDYFGMSANSYNIILASLFHNGGYGPRVGLDNGLYDVYGILGPNNIRMNGGKCIPEYSCETIRYLVWHEFGHSFVNPTTEKHIDEINKYSELYSRISEIMSSQAYTNWEVCVNEHIIRAVTTRLSYIHLGEAAGDRALANERSGGFFYIDALCKSLEHYENNRDKYPDFESYYPQLIQVFKELSEQELPDSFFKSDFIGPINFAFVNNDDKKTVLIIPTNEKDKDIQEQIKRDVKSIRKQFFKDFLNTP